MAHPVGICTRTGRGKVRFCSAHSAYSRAADAIVPVSQYVVAFASSSSLVKRRSTSPPQSLNERNISTSHAASPAGESFTAKARVCGRVVFSGRWMTVPAAWCAAQSRSPWRSLSVSPASGSADPSGGSPPGIVRYSAHTPPPAPERTRSVVMIAPQSPPAAPYRW